MTAKSNAPLTGVQVTFSGVVHVYRAFGVDVAALRGIDLVVPPGQHVALLGPSGSGKSTLLTLLAGIRSPSAGRIVIDDQDIARLSERQLRRYRARTVGTLLQGAAGNLLPYAGAAANVRFARRALPRGNRAALPAVSDLLTSVGVPTSSMDTPIARLSAGRQQTVALAVALANAPRLLVADEPTSQLDDVARDGVLDALIAAATRSGTTVLVVTHDTQVAARLERVIHLSDGRVASEEHRQERLAVLGADRTLQLPGNVATAWPDGTRLRVIEVGPDELRVLRVEGP